MSYLATKDDAEIDLIIERPGLKSLAIEVKSTHNVLKLDAKKLNGTLNLFKDLKNFDCFIFSNDPIEKKVNDVLFLNWKTGLLKIGFI